MNFILKNHYYLKNYLKKKMTVKMMNVKIRTYDTLNGSKAFFVNVALAVE